MRKHIDIPNFDRGQYYQTICHNTNFLDCTFFLYIPAKIFDSSHIFGEISIFDGLQRFFKILKNLCLCLWSFFWTQRFFVFVFGPFSIFFATLFLNCYKTKQNYGYNTFKWNDGQFQKFAIVQRRPISYFIDIYKLDFNQKENGFPTEL